MNRRTVINRDYRYTLWREFTSEWGNVSPFPQIANAGGYCMFIGLNPSTADARQDDPTIRRCIGFAQAWGYQALCMTNLFAWRATDPRILKCQTEPIGRRNDFWLAECAHEAGIIVAAWGDQGGHRGRAAAVRELLSGHNLHVLGLNQSGEPRHPLYLPKSTFPFLLPR